VLPVPVERAAQAAAGSTTVAGSLASPAAALQMARVVGVLNIARRCRGTLPPHAQDAALAQPLEFPQSLAPFVRFGPERGQYHRGTVVGNALVGALLCAVAAGCGALLTAGSGAVTPKSVQQYAQPTWRVRAAAAALSASRMPGGASVAFALGVDGSVSGAAMLAANSESWAVDGPVVALAAAVNVGLLCAVAATVRRLIGPPLGGAEAERAAAASREAAAAGAFDDPAAASLTQPPLTTSAAREHMDRVAPRQPRLRFVPVRVVRLGSGGEPTFKAAGGLGERALRALLVGTHTWLPATDREYAARQQSAAGGGGGGVLDEQELQAQLLGEAGAAAASANNGSVATADGLASSFADVLAEEGLRARAFTSQAAFEQLGVVLTRYRGPEPAAVLAEDFGDNGAPSSERTPASTMPAAALARLCPWFLCYDLALTALVAVSQGLATVACDEAVALALAANALGLLLAAALRPYSVPAKNVLLVAMNATMLGASAATVAAVRAGSDARAEALAGLAARAAASAAMIGFVSIAFSITRFVVLRGLLRSSLALDLRALRRAEAAARLERAAKAGVPAAAHADGGGAGAGGRGTPTVDVDAASDANLGYDGPDGYEEPPGVMLPEVPASPPVAPVAQPVDLDDLLGTSSSSSDGGARGQQPREHPEDADEDDDAGGEAAAAAFYRAGPARRIYRTQEGQRRLDDLEALLARDPAAGAAASAGALPLPPPPLPHDGTSANGAAPPNVSSLDELLL